MIPVIDTAVINTLWIDKYIIISFLGIIGFSFSSGFSVFAPVGHRTGTFFYIKKNMVIENFY